ncbi:MAG: cadmium resistance transporter [Methanobacteriaceae archaeon]|jgi:cadmium resistance protein CadD (predicted permease)|nr:cadmium resistance transporter [Methanobacteriaceae archaeon]MDO9627915.1 cadmium resistance transporter [Methanobacteriaceae archaeon]
MDILIIVSVAISAFIATNIDDLFLLTVFFAHPQYNDASVVIGQYLGIFSLILISIPVYIFKSYIPDFFMVLMGFIPLLIGLKEIITLYRLETKSRIPISNGSSFSNSESSNSSGSLNNNDNNTDNEILVNKVDQQTFFKDNRLNSGSYSIFTWFSVALITISNGVDNIGVYAPLFSTLNQMELLLTILIFLIMTGIWCFFAHLIIKNKLLGIKIEKYGHIILPFVLILLGIGIIVSNYMRMS